MSPVAQDLKPRILVLEDNYLTADALCELVRDCGCDVAGAVGRVESAFEFLEDREIDGAVVDINLHGNPSFPVCDELQRRNVPFFFLSGYERSVIPDAFAERPLLTKPVDQDVFRTALADFGRISPIRRTTRPAFGNGLLDALPELAVSALAPKLEQVSLKAGQVLHVARQEVSHVHFPTDGLVSLVARGARGRRLEVGLIGREGMTGAAALLDDAAIAAIDTVVQVPGQAWRVPVEELVPLLRDHRSLQNHLLRYVHALMAQMAQTALATGHGKIEQRVARWLLMAAQRCNTQRLEVTHEHLSQVLAVRRSGITVALHMLEARRVIKSQRKVVEILDHAGLLREADGLYGPPEGP